MRRLAVLVFLLSSFLCSLAAQQPDIKIPGSSTPQTPSEAKAPKPAGDDKGAKTTGPSKDQPKDKKDYSQEGFVIEQVRTLYRFESDGTGRKETIARVRVRVTVDPPLARDEMAAD